MPQNIDAITVIKNRGFGIKVDALKRLNEDPPEVFELYSAENGQEIDIYDLPDDKDILLIDKFDIGGEFSGWFWDDFLKEIQNSVGYYQAVVTWNWGDRLDVHTIEDGKHKTEDLIEFIRKLQGDQ